MKIAVVGANGNLGSRVVRYALERGFDVKAFVYMGDCPVEGVSGIDKNLFDLAKEDIADCDILISCFGGGFKTDPIINKNAFLKYIDLVEGTSQKLIAIGGAGSLFTDETHAMYEYQSPTHFAKLVEISHNIRLGIDELLKHSFNWTVVCPSRKFELNGPLSKDYIVGEKEEIIYNDEGNSYVTYNDLAWAMLDIAENDSFKQQVITIASRVGE